MELVDELSNVQLKDLVFGWITVECEKGKCMVKKEEYVCKEKDYEYIKQNYDKLPQTFGVEELCKLAGEFAIEIANCIERNECGLTEAVRESVKRKKENIITFISIVPIISRLSRKYIIRSTIDKSIDITFTNGSMVSFYYKQSWNLMTIHLRRNSETHPEENTERKVKKIVQELLAKDYITLEMRVENPIEFVKLFNHYSSLFL